MGATRLTDDVFPYVQDRKTFAVVLGPYSKSPAYFITKGDDGRTDLLEFNLKLAGKKITELEDPVKMPVLWEPFEHREYKGLNVFWRVRWVAMSKSLVVKDIHSQAEFDALFTDLKYPTKRYGKPLPLSIGATFKYPPSPN